MERVSRSFILAAANNPLQREISGIALLEYCTIRKIIAAVNNSDVVQSKKSSLKDVVALYVYFVYPPSEIE